MLVGNILVENDCENLVFLYPSKEAELLIPNESQMVVNFNIEMKVNPT